MTDRLYERISKIPGPDGFWKPDSETVFIAAAEDMRNACMKDDDIFDILEDLYRAVADCYGD